MEKKKAILKIEFYSSKDGMLLLSVQDYGVRAMLKDLVELCVNKYGGYVKIEASPSYKPRTTGAYSQDHHLNGHIMQICNLTGNGPKDKDILSVQ